MCVVTFFTFFFFSSFCFQIFWHSCQCERVSEWVCPDFWPSIVFALARRTFLICLYLIFFRLFLSILTFATKVIYFFVVDVAGATAAAVVAKTELRTNTRSKYQNVCQRISFSFYSFFFLWCLCSAALSKDFSFPYSHSTRGQNSTSKFKLCHCRTRANYLHSPFIPVRLNRCDKLTETQMMVIVVGVCGRNKTSKK